jgi:hypothetical protein
VFKVQLVIVLHSVSVSVQCVCISLCSVFVFEVCGIVFILLTTPFLCIIYTQHICPYPTLQYKKHYILWLRGKSNIAKSSPSIRVSVRWRMLRLVRVFKLCLPSVSSSFLQSVFKPSKPHVFGSK